MLSGCLVEDPPEYRAPTRTPPRLNLAQALPPINQVWVTELDKPVTFEIPVSSEDAGIQVRGFLFVDKPGEDEPVPWGAGQTVPPSTLDDVTRKLVFNKTVSKNAFLGGEPLGCHVVTLTVTHTDNFDGDTPGKTLQREDVAEAYWYMNVIASGEDGSVLRDCPQASVEMP